MCMHVCVNIYTYIDILLPNFYLGIKVVTTFLNFNLFYFFYLCNHVYN